MHISERIFSRRSALGLSKAALGKAIGITGVSVGKWESGLNQPKGRYLNDLAAALDVSVDWLLTGKDGDGGVVGDTQPSGYHNVEPAVIPQGRRVPILSYVQAGHWREMCEQATAFDGSLEYVAVGVSVGSCAFGLWVRGNSMEPDFKEGDLLIVDPDEAPKAGDFVIAKNGSEEATFKKFRSRGEYDDGSPRFELVPLNDDHETLSTDHTTIAIIGVVVEHRRILKR
ncbi:helix-turn-helix domain-containing protein [Aeromonas salmonicida]|uniref:S24 family peptidase n=1 Tax=Aeromonas salmonicida TaxID=645 RepID=UPI00259DAE3C|nr:S24 family peptidase [Aeromonas salmonicida]MDM5136566.1 helix-turn-helix domain-containing protein [Aeromonas salmonicida]